MISQKISDDEFNLFRNFIHDQAGIQLSDEKKTLITSRLNRRLRHYSLDNYQAYYNLMFASDKDGERQIVIDLLTTNETYFFREPKHFQVLKNEVLANWKGGKTFRAWSAASSSGEEAYSIAMILDDVLGRSPWEIFASDISSRVLEKARQGHYNQERIDGIPKNYLKKYCLKGTGDYNGTLLIDNKLRQKVNFSSVNLKRPMGDVGSFNIIFLRNVLIYFNMETKQQIIKQLVDRLQPQGYLFIGHSESLKGIYDGLKTIIPTVYQKP